MIDRKLNYGRQHIARFLRKAAPYLRVLDVGAGSGADLQLAKAACHDAELHAIECNAKAAAVLAKRGIHVHQLNLEHDSLPFAPCSVDVLIANQILEHTKELFWIFHEVTRVLRDGGSFIIGVPNLASLHNRVLLALGRQPTAIKSASAHVRGFTRSDLLHFVDTCFPGGYQLQDAGGANFYPLPRILARPAARLFPNLAWGLFVHLKKVQPYAQQFLDYPEAQALETPFFLG